MTATIHQGDVFEVLAGGSIAAGSVDIVITSPPYWMLRSYLPKDHPLKHLEIGSEPTPQAYVEKMVRVFRIVRTCMADHATCWVNIGDTYSGGAGGRGDIGNIIAGYSTRTESVGQGRIQQPTHSIPAGNLCLIPQRLAIALQDDKWVVRSVVVWHKPAPMPSSVAGWAWRKCRVKVKDGQMRRADAAAHRPQLPVDGKGRDRTETVGATAQWSDCPGCPKCIPNGGYVLRRGSWRPTSSWEPVLMLAKSDRYFCDGEAVKQPYARIWNPATNGGTLSREERDEFVSANNHYGPPPVPGTGANLRDVWTIAAEPLREKHYAAYPTELVLRCLKAGTSAKGYCPACGMPWCRVVGETTYTQHRPSGSTTPRADIGNKHCEDGNWGTFGTNLRKEPVETLGWRPSCSCPGATDMTPRPGRVLDPFAGSGRTGLAANRLGLDFVGVDLNESYVEMAKKILYEDSPLFA